MDAPDFTQLPVANERADLLVKRVGPLVEHGGEDLFRAAAMRGKQFFAIVLVDRDRFLDEDVQAVLERVDADGRVRIMRRDDQHRIGVAGADQRAWIGVSLRLRVKAELARVAVADRRQPQPRRLSRLDAARVDGPHDPKADDSEANFGGVVSVASRHRNADG